MLDLPVSTMCLRRLTAALGRLEEHLRDAWLLDVDQVWLEHALGRLEPLRADLDHSAIGKLTIAIVQFRRFGRYRKLRCHGSISRCSSPPVVGDLLCRSGVHVEVIARS